MEYTVYVHISPSNKRYVGITSQNVSDRWQIGGNGYKNQILFWRAICKYGWDNFTHIIIKNGISKQEAIQLERSLIAKYGSNVPEFGYNLTAGGEGHTGYSPKHSTRCKLSKAIKNSWRDEGVRYSHQLAKYKPIVQYTIEGNFVAEFPSVLAASEAIGGSGMSYCASGKQKTSYGYVWRWKGEPFSAPEPKPRISDETRDKLSRASKKVWDARRKF